MGKDKTVFTDFKLDYMARCFQKIEHKKFESYVLQRIWHRLNDDDVRFVFQQGVVREGGRDHALLDLYLPQINLAVEVNEAYHETEEQVERDLMRNVEIMEKINANLLVVSCARSLETVHNQVERVVEVIRRRVAEEKSKGTFVPWGGYDEMSPSYYQKQGYIEVRPYGSYVRTIDDAFAIFGAQPKHRGFLRAAGAEMPGRTDGNWLVWCPIVNNANWGNEMYDNGNLIDEYPKESNGEMDKEAARLHLEKYLALRERRATFLKEKDDLGFNFYRFVGVFELDEASARQKGHCVWRKISDRYELK